MLFLKTSDETIKRVGYGNVNQDEGLIDTDIDGTPLAYGAGCGRPPRSFGGCCFAWLRIWRRSSQSLEAPGGKHKHTAKKSDVESATVVPDARCQDARPNARPHEIGASESIIASETAMIAESLLTLDACRPTGGESAHLLERSHSCIAGECGNQSSVRPAQFHRSFVVFSVEQPIDEPGREAVA